ncbi:MAG: AsmA family protein, partial [candidate division NC10 bacterium]|nr:AsmA family protein [candidate division NC10 bacterium]
MRKLIVAAVVLLVLGGLTVFALMNLDRLVNRNKDYILAQAEQALGRKITVQDIGVTLWGGVGVRLKDVTLSDDRAFSTQDFLRTADLQVNVAFFPLLRKELQIKRLILHKPVLTVIRDKSGTFNFASIGAPGRAERPAPSAGGGPPAPAGRAIPLLAALVDVSGGEVRYVDRTAGTELHVSQVDLTVRDVGVDRPVAIKAAAAVLADRRNLSIQGQVGPLRFTAGGPALDELPVKMEFKIGPVTMETLRRFAPVAAWLPRDLKVDGPLSFSGRADGTLENFTLTGQLDATASRVRYGELLHKPQGMPLRLAAEARVTPGIIEVHKGTLAMHTLELAGTGTMTRGTSPALRFSVDSKRTDLNGWEKVVPLPQGYALAGRAEVHARIEGALAAGRIPDVTGSLVLSELRATLPQTPHPLTAQSATVT